MEIINEWREVSISENGWAPILDVAKSSGIKIDKGQKNKNKHDQGYFYFVTWATKHN